MGTSLPPHAAAPMASSTPGRQRHECPICGKMFDRKDHLTRHVASHLNTRDHVCPRCPKRFNRRDLLARHIANHSHGTPRSRPRGPNRAAQACEACVRAKAKCSNQWPCQRCEVRGVACRDARAGRSRDWDKGLSMQAVDGDEFSEPPADPDPDPDPNPAPALAPPTPGTDVFHMLWNFAPANRSHGFGAFGAEYALPFGSGPGMPDLMMDGSSPDEAIYWDNFSLAPTDLLGMSSMGHDMGDFLSFNGMDGTLQSMPEEPAAAAHTHDYLLSESAVQPVQPVQQPPAHRRRLPALAPSPATSPPGESAASRRARLSNAVASGHKAYQRSPWLFTPVAQDHAYSESQALSVDEQQLERQLRAESSEVRPAQRRRQPSTPSLPTLPRPMDAAARDAILAMAIQFSKTATPIRSFPSCDLLNVLAKAFFVREASRPDPWIHPATLFEEDKDHNRCRIELLAAIVAGGATLFAAPKVWRMGLALQEVVKLAIRSAVDNDNRLTRHLQVFQAFVLWVEIALWSGHRRKMEIGEGFASSIITMLRRAGTFRQGYYARLSVPDAMAHAEEWTQTWLQWVRQQSFKRLALHTFITEMRASIAFTRSPMISVAELSFALPAARDLWDAGDAQAWKAQYLAKDKQATASATATSLTVVDGMYNTSQLASGLGNVDLGLGSLAILYGFWCPVWAYLDARATTNMAHVTSTTADSSSRRQELYHAIQTTSLKLRALHALCPEGQLVSEFLMLSLHAAFEDMQRFAGRYGVDEFKQALPRLQAWAAHSEDQYYTAAWHAGQVLRAARAFPATHLRGFPAVAVYQACLTLFVFAVLRRMSGSQTPLDTDTDRAPPPPVLLDGEETIHVRTFLRTGHGRPRLLVAGHARDLDNPVVIGTVMAETFRSNYPAASEPLPPLLDSLVSLMGDICQTFVAE
ncbi:hypothetical protein SCUCBS95973_003666 [Sporothrix curviconia]|uniref:Uncharacterized protein n=1 Tax=Sporothrix curviconia TaxID=1260050 RepID=A0ABP0BHI8_9PEZI